MKLRLIAITAAISASVSAFAAASQADRSVYEIHSAINALSTAAEKTQYVNGLTMSEYRALLDYVISVAETNKVAGKRAFAVPVNLRWRLFVSCRQLAEEYDARLANAGIETDPTFAYEHLPLCSESFITNKANESVIAAKRYFVDLCRKYHTHRMYTYQFPEIVNLAATLSAIGRCKYYMRDNFKESVLAAAARPIKRRIREQGGSFVVGPDGRNPVQEAVDELSNALNAPKMRGAKEWVAKWFPGHVWVEPDWKTDEEIRKLKEDVLFGERDFGYLQANLLESYLGTEAYNAFVKEYNGSGK